MSHKKAKALRKELGMKPTDVRKYSYLGHDPAGVPQIVTTGSRHLSQRIKRGKHRTE